MSDREFYRPTMGEEVGTWNVFPRDGSPPTLSVQWADLPGEVRRYVIESRRRHAPNPLTP